MRYNFFSPVIDWQQIKNLHCLSLDTNRKLNLGCSTKRIVIVNLGTKLPEHFRSFPSTNARD